MTDRRQLEQEKAKLLEAVAFHKKRADEAIKAAMDLDVKAGMYRSQSHHLHEQYHKALEAMELMDIENEGLKATLSEALGMLRDGLRAYEDEQYASILEGFVRDAVGVMEAVE